MPKFDYMFAGDPNTTMPELAALHGQHITVVRAATEDEADIEEVGPMQVVRFDDGTENHAFPEEVITNGEWAIVDEAGGVSDRFDTYGEAYETLDADDYPAGHTIAYVPNPEEDKK